MMFVRFCHGVCCSFLSSALFGDPGLFTRHFKQSEESAMRLRGMSA